MRKMWQASGLQYPQLIDRLIQLALERHDDKKRNKITYSSRLCTMADRRREPSKQETPIPRTPRRSRRVVGGKTSVRVVESEPRATPIAPRPKAKARTFDIAAPRIV